MAVREGRCVSCGFLAWRPARNESQRYARIVEVDETERRDPIHALRANLQPENVGGLVWEIICFRRAADLTAEIGGAGDPRTDTQSRAAAAERAFNKDRGCAQWYEYIPGLDPKDHLMERRLQDLEKDRRAFQAALNKAPQALTVAAVILAAAQVMTMTPDSLLYKLGEGCVGFIRSHWPW